MKKIFISITLLLCSFLIFSQTTLNQFLIDGIYDFTGQENITLDNIFTTYKADFGLSSNDEMVLNEDRDEKGAGTFYRFSQYHKGYEVYGTMYNLHTDGSNVQMASGFVVDGLDLAITPIISEDLAITNAIAYFNAEKYAWQEIEIENELKDFMEDNTATNYPKGKLIIQKKYGDAYLVLPLNTN